MGLLQVSRGVLLITIVGAPWLHGTTTGSGLWILEAELLGCALLWTVGILQNRRMPRIRGLSAANVMSILSLGWWMALYPRAVYDVNFHAFVQIDRTLPNFPGSVDGCIATRSMVRITLLAGAFLIAADFGSNQKWRRAVLAALTASGAVVAIFGVVFRPGSTLLAWFWSRTEIPGNVFGTFWYHGNAGAFLNLCYPCALSTMYRSGGRSSWQVAPIFGLLSAIAIGVGICVNASKASHAILGLVTVSHIVALARQKQVSPGNLVPMRAWRLPVMILTVAILLLGCLGGLNSSLKRWAEISGDDITNGRVKTWKACIPLVRDAGAFGMGPGAFEAVFPPYQIIFDDAMDWHWRYAHSDYLQALVEWGFVGFGLWGALILSGIYFGNRTQRGNEARQRGSTNLETWALNTALGATLIHALVDFPLQIAVIQLYFMVLLGILTGTAVRKAKNRSGTLISESGSGIRVSAGLRIRGEGRYRPSNA